MNLDKDTYEYILNFLDDKDIVNMLSVNRKFNDEIIYERVLKRKYPLLVKFKQEKEENETWRHLFLRMIKYISLINEKYDIPYIPLQDYDPEDFFKSFVRDHTDTLKIIAIMLMREKSNNEKHFFFILHKLQERIKERHNFIFVLNILAQRAIEIGNLEKFKILHDKGASDCGWYFILAAREGKLNIIEYMAPLYLRLFSQAVFLSAHNNAKKYKHSNVASYLQSYI